MIPSPNTRAELLIPLEQAVEMCPFLMLEGFQYMLLKYNHYFNNMLRYFNCSKHTQYSTLNTLKLVLINFYRKRNISDTEHYHHLIFHNVEKD